MPTFRNFTDTRDGKVYKIVLMPDGKWWSAENLAWSGAGCTYNDDPAMEVIYGRLYTWAEAMTTCPGGTHLPSDAEWSVLQTMIPEPVGTKLKATSVWGIPPGIDDYGFCALPAGVRYEDGSCGNVFNYAYFWTSTETVAPYIWSVWFRYLGIGDTTLHRYNTNDLDSISVRFIVDIIDTPSSSLPSGKYYQPQTITLSSSDTIYYEIN